MGIRSNRISGVKSAKLRTVKQAAGLKFVSDDADVVAVPKAKQGVRRFVLSGSAAKTLTKGGAIRAARAMSAAREPIVDYKVEAGKFGFQVAEPIGVGQIDHVFDRIAEDAVDVFGTKEAGRCFLETSKIYGEPAKDVAARKGIGRILSRIDELRFGARG